MSETKTEYVVEYRRRGSLLWRCDHNGKFTDTDDARKKYERDAKEFPLLQHRLIRVTVLKESK